MPPAPVVEGCTASSGGSGAAHQQPLTFRSHECAMSVTLLPSSSPALPYAPNVATTSLRRWSPPSPPPHRSNSLTFSLSDSDSDIPDLDLLADSLDDPRRRCRVPAQAYLRRVPAQAYLRRVPAQAYHRRRPAPLLPHPRLGPLPCAQILHRRPPHRPDLQPLPNLCCLHGRVPPSTTPTASSLGSPSTTLAPFAASASPMMTPPLPPTTAGPACLSSSGISLMMTSRMTVAGPWPSGTRFDISGGGTAWCCRSGPRHPRWWRHPPPRWRRLRQGRLARPPAGRWCPWSGP